MCTDVVAERALHPHRHHALDHAVEVLAEQGHGTHRAHFLEVPVEDPGGVHVQDLASRPPRLEDVDEHVEVEPRPLAVGERLRESGEMGAHHDLVGHLCVHSGPNRLAEVLDHAAKDVQKGPASFECARPPADHDPQGCRPPRPPFPPSPGRRACRYRVPRAGHRAVRTPGGEWSTCRYGPGRRAPPRGCRPGPATTSSTLRVVGRLEKMTEARDATSARLPAAAAPSSTRVRTREGSMSWTTTG